MKAVLVLAALTSVLCPTPRSVASPSGPRPVVVASATSGGLPSGAPEAVASPPGRVGSSLGSAPPDTGLAATGSGAPSRSITGSASWYCRPGRSACTRHYPAAGQYAAACAPLRRALGRAWRGRWVTVSRGARSIRVRLIDSCSSSSHAIDLYASAFDDLAPLWHGVIRVRVSG
jgi:hypothetical protein